MKMNPTRQHGDTEIVFRRLYPRPDWDILLATFERNHGRYNDIPRWKLNLRLGSRSVCYLPYSFSTFSEVVTEAEALGCNISAFRHLLLDDPIYSSGSEME